MDDADRAERAATWMHKDDLFKSRKQEGPRPKIASLCLFCGEVIEEIGQTEDGIRKARRVEWAEKTSCLSALWLRSNRVG